MLRRLTARRTVLAGVVLLAAAALTGVTAVQPDPPARVAPADAFRVAMEADEQHRSALRIRRVPVPDLVGQPLEAAERFVAAVPRASLSVGGAGPVVVHQQPSAGSTIGDDGAYLAVTLGTPEQAAAARDPGSAAAKREAEAAAGSYPSATTPPERTATPGDPPLNQVRDPGDTAVTPPRSYPSVVVVITYRTTPQVDAAWSWKVVDTRTATVVGAFAVSPGDGCATPGRQRLAVTLSTPMEPDDEVTVRLDRRVGRNDEVQTATSLPAASSYRGRGLVLFDNGGRLATNPTGDSRC